jgi:hypothetical protein
MQVKYDETAENMMMIEEESLLQGISNLGIHDDSDSDIVGAHDSAIVAKKVVSHKVCLPAL